MKWHRRVSTGAISKLLMRAALPNFLKTELLKDGRDLPGLQRRDLAHGSSHGDGLHPHEFPF